MYYTLKETIDIGRRAFTRSISKCEAAKQYEVTEMSIDNYVKDYLKSEHIPIVPQTSNSLEFYNSVSEFFTKFIFGYLPLFIPKILFM